MSALLRYNASAHMNDMIVGCKMHTCTGSRKYVVIFGYLYTAKRLWLAAIFTPALQLERTALHMMQHIY